MSYSRWSFSCWYTYADSNGGFTACGKKSFLLNGNKTFCRNFSNQELKNLNLCLQFFKDQNIYSKKELRELKEYMEAYIEDETALGNFK